MPDEIDGVRVEPQHIVRNERGHLLEIARCDDGWLPLGQAYLTATRPGVVKAWYRHHHQIDSLTIVGGKARLVLFDDRDGSPTQGLVRRVELDLAAPVRVRVPPMVWHGYVGDGDQDALIVHVNSTPWNPDRPDEDRLAPDDPSMPDIWT